MRPSDPRRRPLVGALLCLVGPSVGLACAPNAVDDPADLTLLFTGTINGYVEPCGCHAGQIGGLDRIAGYVEQELAANPDALFVDAGDVVGEDLELDDNVRRQLPLKAEAFFSAFGELGCEAVAVGEVDLLTLGPDELLRLSDAHGVPVLCGNLVREDDGKPVFPASRIVERAGRRIGIFSLLAPQLEQARVKDPGRFDVAQGAKALGLRVLPWRKRARAIVEQLAPETDLIVFNSHLGYDLNAELARELPEIDVIVGGHADSAPGETNVVEGTPVLISFVRGSRVGRVDWWWPEPDEYFVEDGHGPLADVSSTLVTLGQYHTELADRRDLMRREAEYGTEAWALKLEKKRFAIEQARVALLEADPIPRVNRFAHRQVPMHRLLPRSELALEAVDRYHEDLVEFWSQGDEFSREKESSLYPGPETCATCHPRQYGFWYATRHSYALAALEATGQEVDAECFKCHTVGYKQPGGFRRPGRHQGFEHVQCAACHGPGGPHVAGGASYVEPNLYPDGRSTCTLCHNDEHDPAFQNEGPRKLALVACPPLEPVPERTTPMLAATIAAARSLESRPNPPWADVITTYRKAAMSEHALELAEDWYVRRPESTGARLLLAECYLDCEREREAAAHFRAVARAVPDNLRAWAGLARALAEEAPDEALEAAREAFSLDRSNPERIVLVAQLHLAQGQRQAAREALGNFLELFPAFETQMRPLIDSIADDAQ